LNYNFLTVLLVTFHLLDFELPFKSIIPLPFCVCTIAFCDCPG